MKTNLDWKSARNARWRHYGAIGQARFAEITISAIVTMPTATEEAQSLAARISHDLAQLVKLLKTQKDSNS